MPSKDHVWHVCVELYVDETVKRVELPVGVLAMEALHRQVLPFLLRRMKEDVLQDLPPKIIQDYYCNLSPLQVPPGSLRPFPGLAWK